MDVAWMMGAIWGYPELKGTPWETPTPIYSDLPPAIADSTAPHYLGSFHRSPKPLEGWRKSGISELGEPIKENPGQLILVLIWAEMQSYRISEQVL